MFSSSSMGKKRWASYRIMALKKVTEAHPDRDLYFYASEVTDEGFVLATPGTYVIFYPEDIHRPCCAVNDEPAKVLKIVVKVAMKLLA